MASPPTSDDPLQVAFVCVQNAGRSQMCGAFAERAVRERGLADRVEVLTGGTDPADGIHPVVVEAMAEVGIDLGDRSPTRITSEALAACDVVVTMGCSTLDLPASVDARDWALPDPHGEPLATVREIRETCRARVDALLDELPESASGD